MLVARAPVRVSFAGGGTDFPAYFRDYGGLVVSTTINRYVYVVMNLNGQGSVQITSSDYRMFYRHPAGKALTWDGELALPQAVLHEFGIDRGVSVFTASETPPGTGLGSSSATAVALVKALATACQFQYGKAQIAELACKIEIDKLGAPIGWQDQYATAHGGLNAIWFSADEVRVERLEISADTRSALERRLMIFFTRSSRDSATILSRQKASSERKDPLVLRSLHALKAAALETKRSLEVGDLDRFGAILDEAWQQKKCLARGITNDRIDAAYDLARQNGASGGKVAGAGGGGFLLLYCDESRQQDVATALEAVGMRRMDFRFETGGAMVLTNAMPRRELFSHLANREPVVAGQG